MRLMMVLLALVAGAAYAADRSRCAEDLFGNIVCMDKDGVLSNEPRSAAYGDAAQGGAEVSEAEKKRRAEVREKLRCKTDPFGNKVCRE